MKRFSKYFSEAKSDVRVYDNPLPTSLHAAFFALGKADGVEKDDVIPTSTASWRASALNPTQEDVYLAKSLSMAIGSRTRKGIAGGDLKSIVSKDKYILDGHHRWAATLFSDPTASITGIKVDMGIKELVPILRAAGDAFGNARRGAPKGDTNIFSATNKDALDAILLGKGMDPAYYDAVWPKEWLDSIGGEKELYNRLAGIKSHKIPAGAPKRSDMPVIDADKGQEITVAQALTKGNIDIKAPYGK